jgi:hypothetical protein
LPTPVAGATAGAGKGESKRSSGMERVAIAEVRLATVERIKKSRSRRCSCSLRDLNKVPKSGISPSSGTLSSPWTV